MKLDPKQADARFLSAELALAERDLARGRTLAKELAADRHDGYAVQMLLAEAARVKKDVGALRAALEAAHRFDPRQAEPLVGLSEVMRQSGNVDEEIVQLKKLVELEQHEPLPYRRLLRLLLDKRRFDEARAVGEAAIWADVEGLQTHALVAEAYSGSAIYPKALVRAGDSALVPGPPEREGGGARAARGNLPEAFRTARSRRATASSDKAWIRTTLD